MRYKPEHRQKSRQRILVAAGRGFRERGYEGIGVDGLAKEAGVTSGAFYGHFPSKSAAFTEAVVVGIRELHDGVERLQTEHGSDWIELFIDFYLGARRTCDLGEACALQTLTPEVMRLGGEVREAFEAELLVVIERVSTGLPQSDDSDRRARAWALMALLSGTVTIARTVLDEELAAKIASGVRRSAISIATS